MSEAGALDERALILAPVGRDAALAAAALTEAGVRADICADVDALCREIASGAGAVLVTKDALGPSELPRLAAALAGQPPWSDLPLIVLTTGGASSAEGRRRLQAIDALGGATLLERPLRVATLVHAVRSALAARRRQYEVRDHLAERARLEQALQAEYEKQARIAETLQRSLLPRPSRDAFPGLEIGTFYQAAWSEAEIGGDFYDAFLLENEKVALVVGDVSGKGLAAASRTAEVKFALRAFLREDPSPARALDRLNDYLLDAQTLDGQSFDSFVALSLCILDVSGDALFIASAGAEPPLLRRASGGVTSFPNGGPPLGATAWSEYSEQQTGFRPGDTVLMVTDGITEARQGSQFFGSEGLVKVIEGTRPDEGPVPLGQTILHRATEFAGGKLSDDVCLLLVRRRPDSGSNSG